MQLEVLYNFCLMLESNSSTDLGPKSLEEGRLHYRITEIGQLAIDGTFPKSPS